MKNLVSIILVTVCFTANAQINTSNRTDYNEKTGSLRMTLDKNELISAQTLATNKTRLELPQETNLKISTQKTDNNGIIHYKYAQYHEGVRVEGGELLIHEKNGKAIGANGKILKGLTKEKRTVLSEEQALQKAISSFGAAHFVWNVPASNLPPQTNISRDLPEGELVWLPAEIGRAHV